MLRGSKCTGNLGVSYLAFANDYLSFRLLFAGKEIAGFILFSKLRADVCKEQLALLGVCLLRLGLLFVYRLHFVVCIFEILICFV